MPWYDALPQREDSKHTVSCQRTCELLELFGEDLPRSKFLIRTARNSPAGIQMAQWERILRGETVNLDNFLSSVCHTTVDEERKARVGATTLSFSTYEPKRKVKSASDWGTAWRQASEAIAFAFPHQADELSQYAFHIQSEFDTKHPAAHQRIIMYDIAI